MKGSVEKKGGHHEELKDKYKWGSKYCQVLNSGPWIPHPALNTPESTNQLINTASWVQVDVSELGKKDYNVQDRGVLQDDGREPASSRKWPDKGHGNTGTNFGSKKLRDKQFEAAQLVLPL